MSDKGYTSPALTLFASDQKGGAGGGGAGGGGGGSGKTNNNPLTSQEKPTLFDENNEKVSSLPCVTFQATLDHIYSDKLLQQQSPSTTQDSGESDANGSKGANGGGKSANGASVGGGGSVGGGMTAVVDHLIGESSRSSVLLSHSLLLS